MSVRRFVRRLLWIGSSSVLAGVLLVGFFAWLALHIRWEIPELTDQLHGPSTVLARDGTVLGRFTSEFDRRVVPLSAVSQDAIDAVIASEDARFYQHEGVDPLAVLRAVVSNVRTGEITQGGSTLTQQFVKNAFTDRERTLIRKVREAVISIQLERDLGKDEILQRYLNTVYMGEGAYGIEAAALTYFGVPASQLTAAQGATLAQLLPAPSARNPRADPEGARERRDRVLEVMGTLGMLSPDEVAAAESTPLEVQPRQPQTVLEPYFFAYVRQILVDEYGEEQVLTGGLEVHTTLDPVAQQALDETVKARVPTLETGFEAGAAAIVPTTGEVLAMYGGYDFYGDTSNYSPTNYEKFNLALARRQPGSTIKPIVLLAALEAGMDVHDRYPAPAALDVGGPEPVHNASGRGYGELRLDEALVQSVNTVYAQLGLDVGPERVVQMMERLGVRSPIDAVGLIGIGGTRGSPSPLDMASAYATIANDGLACPARTILEVRGPDGQPLERPRERRPPAEVLDARPDDLAELDTEDCYQAVDGDLARTVTQILEQAVARGTGTRAQIGRPQAGKTGTTNDYRDAWFAGYTPELSLVVWMGDPDEPREMRDVAGVARVFGGTIPAQVWRDAAARILEPFPATPFPEPGEGSARERRAPPARSRTTAAPSAGPSGEASPTIDEEPSDDPTATDEPSEGEPSPTRSPSPTPSPSPTDDDDRCLPPIITEGCD